MAYLYQEINKVPGLSGSSYDRQKQLYERLGSPMGSYRGSYDQNIWLLGKVQSGQYGGGGNSQPQQQSQPQRDTSGYDRIIEEQRRQEAERQAKLEAQKKEQEGLFTEYGTKMGSQEKLTDAYSRLLGEMGIADDTAKIDTFKSGVRDLQAGLEDTDAAIAERTKGKFVSDAQRARLVATEKGALYDKLSRLARNYEPVLTAFKEKMAGVGTKLGLLTQDQMKELRPIEARINALGDRFARELTGFNQDKQNALNLLLAKVEREGSLADQEWQQVNALAKEEREWARTKEELALKKSLGLSDSGSNNPYLTPSATTPAADTTGTSTGGSDRTILPTVPTSSSGGMSTTLPGQGGYGGYLFGAPVNIFGNMG